LPQKTLAARSKPLLGFDDGAIFADEIRSSGNDVLQLFERLGEEVQ
jgi:hypothetical protein